jgi:D-alanine-D-alanine ligase
VKKIAIIFGGNSVEHEISIVSAISLYRVLKQELIFVFVDNEREMFLIENKNLKASYFTSFDYKKSSKISFLKKGFLKKGFLKDNIIKCESIINLIHGQDGEDGVMTSLLKWFDFKYISPSTQSSVISYDKILTKLYAKEKNINILDYEVFKDSNNIKTKFDFPVIVKPARLGSSIGINIVNNKDELAYFVDEALEYDDSVILEPFINNIQEFNLAGYFNTNENKFYFSKIEEVRKKKILDFKTKYMDFAREDLILEANISEKLKEEMKESFSIIYNTVFINSVIRCDFFIYKDKVYLNEINSIPGSMANYLFDDFNKVVNDIFLSFKKDKKIHIEYSYMNDIKKAK